MSFTNISLQNIADGQSAYLAFDNTNGFRLFREVEDSGVIYLHDITALTPEAPLELLTSVAIVDGSLLIDRAATGNFATSLNTSVGQIVKIDGNWYNVNSYLNANTVTLDRNLSFNSSVTFTANRVNTSGVNSLLVGDRVLFDSVTLLPSGITTSGVYYVQSTDSGGFALSLTEGGLAITFPALPEAVAKVFKVHTVNTTNYNPDHLRDTILGRVRRTGIVYTLEPFYTVNDSNVTPVTIVNGLPTLGQYEGQVVINALDNNIYTWNGLAWVTTTSNTARTVTLTSTTQAFTYTSIGTIPSPSTATLTATAFNVEGVPYYQFLVDGVSVQNTTSNTYVYTPRANLSGMPDVLEVRVREDSDSTPVIATDQITCFGVAPGSDAITILLSNEAHTLPADFDGSNPVLAGSGTDIRVYKGNELLNYSATLASDPSFKVVVFSQSGCTAGSISGSGTTATLADLAAMSATRGSVVLDITVLSEGAETIYQKVQSLAKSLEGIPGAGGTDAITVQLTSNDYSIIYNEAGTTPVPSSVTLTAQAQNVSTPYYTFRESSATGTVIQASSTDADVVISTPSSFFSPSKTYWVGVAATNGGTILAYDTISVFAVRASADGQDSYTVIISNDAHTMPASSSGSVTSYDGSGTVIEAFLGSTQLQRVSGTPTTGEFSVSASGTNITPGSISTSGTDALVADHSSMTADAARITYTVNLENIVTVTKVQSFAKALAGTPGSLGTGASVVKLDTPSYVIAYNADGTTPNPSGTLTLTATAQNIDDPWFKFTATPTIGGFDEATFTDGSGSTDTKNFTIPSSYFATPYKFRVDVSDGDQAGLAFDTISVYAVRPGINAITGFITNEAHVVAASFEGTGMSYTTAGGNFIVYDGVTNVSSSAIYAISGGTDGGATWTKTQNGLTFTINETTGAYTLGGSTWSTDTESFTATATYNGVTISKTYTITKSKAGAPVTYFYMNTSTDVLKRNVDNSLTPGTVTASAFSVTGNGTPVAYAGRFRVYRNGVLVYSSASNETSYVYTPATPSLLTDVTIELWQAGGFTVLLDSEAVQVVQDGANGITVSVDNDNITYSGPVSGFAGINFGAATSTIRVYIGSTQLSYAASGANSFSCTQTSSGITVATGTGSGTTFVVPVPTSMANVNAYTDVTVTIRDAANVASTQTVRITYSLARAGNDSNAYWVVSSADAIKRNESNALTPASITFTGFRAAGASAPALYSCRFQVFRNATLVYTSATDETTYTYTPSDPATLSYVQVKMYLAGGVLTLVDEETIPVVVDGGSAYTISIDNDSKVFVGPPSGFTGISFGGSTSTIKVYRGSAQINYNTSGANTFSVVQTSTGATVATGTVGGGNSFIVPVPTAMSTDVAFTELTITIRDSASLVSTQTVRINYALARQGGQGTTGLTGSQGTTGPQGSLTRYAYAKLATGTNFNTDTTPVVIAGDNLPPSNSWGQTVTWSTSPVSIATNETMYMVNGSYNVVTGQTTWFGPPFLAYLRVGQLSALSADLGVITAGEIRSGTTGQNRLIITPGVIEVFDSANVRRVRLGVWT
jgi:hypothetical protein